MSKSDPAIDPAAAVELDGEPAADVSPPSPAGEPAAVAEPAASNPPPRVEPTGPRAVAAPHDESEGFACADCGRTFAKKQSLGGHRSRCKVRLAGGAPAAAPVPLEAWTAAAAEERGANPASSATQAASRAEAALRGSSPDAGAPEILARLARGNVGVPEVIALACLRAFPPELEDAEYRALCAIYSDGLELPPWVLKIVVTGAIIGPRIAAHPTVGPWIRAQLVPSSAAAPAAKPRAVAPAPAPVSSSPPPAAAAPASSSPLRPASRVELDADQLAALGGA